MIERHVTFEVLQGKEDAFEQLFIQEYRPAMSRMAGFVRLELLRASEVPLPITRWSSALKRWKPPPPGGPPLSTRRYPQN